MVAESNDEARPAWVSRDLYPFASHYFSAPRGRLHYVDEGRGAPLVFVHGNPSWSFEYRHLIAALRDRHRCIAPDHLGFGLSALSRNPADYHPAAHAENFAALMDHLKLEQVTLVVADWGGPIALDFARRHPERIRGLVILNSWCWPVDKDPHFVRFSAVMSSWPVQFLIRHFNLFVTQVMPRGLGNRAVLTDAVMAHYVNAQANAPARAASAALPGYILGATDWLREIWSERAAFTGKPALLLWGLKDIAFRRNELETWQAQFTHWRVQEFPDGGHSLAEEAPDAVAAAIGSFLGADSLGRS